MKAWRMAITALSCLLLSGCLVTFKDPIPANEAAPIPLLGDWERKDEWGDQQYLSIVRAGSNLYRARAWSDADDQAVEEYGFTVAHHGRRWYISAGLPKRLGANFAIAGFELTAKNELVIYNLDVERILQEMDGGTLQGQPVETPTATRCWSPVRWTGCSVTSMTRPTPTSSSKSRATSAASSKGRA